MILFQEPAEFPSTVPELPSHFPFKTSMIKNRPEFDARVTIEERLVTLGVIVHHKHVIAALRQCVGEVQTHTFRSSATVDITYSKTDVLHNYFPNIIL